MVIGMATQKLTITLQEEQLKEIRDLVAAGQAANVSSFVQHAVGIALNDAAGWQHMLEAAMTRTGGPLTDEERAWADAILDSHHAKKKSRRGKAA
jgi:Arc/MetJ-type ribon-helix-helix transcriptional regulator